MRDNRWGNRAMSNTFLRALRVSQALATPKRSTGRGRGNNPMTDEQKEALRSDCEAGIYTVNEVADMHGVSITTVYNYAGENRRLVGDPKWNHTPKWKTKQ